MRYIYITTNKVNGKRYLGQRKTPKDKTPQNDTYLGSGTLLLKAIKKYGKENFSKEVIHVCKNQKEADFLEIKEIQQREILENKDKWYNRDAGGQYGRSEKHSQLTSVAMKDFYSNDEKYTVAMIKINRIKHEKGLKPYITTKAQLDIERLRRRLVIENNRYNRIEKRKVNKLIKDAIKAQKTKEYKKSGKNKGFAPVFEKHSNLKDMRADGLRAYHAKNKLLGIKSYTNDARIKFMLAKFKQYDNNVGIWLYDKGLTDYSIVERKIKKLTTSSYKLYNDYVNQIHSVISIINSEANIIITTEELIEQVNVKRVKRGLIPLKSIGSGSPI